LTRHLETGPLGWAIVLIGVVLVVALAFRSPDSENVTYAGDGASLRIMPLGDSITQGMQASYRRPLWNALHEAGWHVDFVGSMNKGYLGLGETRDYDSDHEGHWGWMADEVLDRIDEWSAKANPDIVLVHIGTNDIGSGESIPGTVDEVRQIIERLRARNPGVHVLLAAIIPSAHEQMRERIREFNLRLSALAEDLDSDSSRVILVDQFTGFDASLDTYDGLHPNDEGIKKMSSRWFDALQPLLEAASAP
jgi:lysophospholipase L1-like esterase